MTAQLSDILPFAHARTIGLPFHGLVTAGKLALPDASTMDYPQPRFYGHTNLVRHPKAAALVRTAVEQADDTTKNYQWLTYALLSGTESAIGGQSLGQNHWIYCDENVAWDVEVIVEAATDSDLTATVKLHEPFGVLSVAGRDLSMTERILATHTWTVLTTSGTAVAPSDIIHCGNRPLLSCKADGSVALLNLYNTKTPGSYWLHNVLRVTLSGNGSTVPGSIGTGISASITMEVTAPDTYSSDSSVDQDTDGWSCVIESDGAGGAQFTTGGSSTTYSLTLTQSTTRKQLWTILPDGTITNLEFTEHYESVSAYSDSIVGGETGSYSISYSAVGTTTYTVTFGGGTVTYQKVLDSSASDSGSYNVSGIPGQQSICLDFPGTDEVRVCTAGGETIDCDDILSYGIAPTIDTNNLVYINTPTPQLISAGGQTATCATGASGTWHPETGAIASSVADYVCWV